MLHRNDEDCWLQSCIILFYLLQFISELPQCHLLYLYLYSSMMSFWKHFRSSHNIFFLNWLLGLWVQTLSKWTPSSLCFRTSVINTTIAYLSCLRLSLTLTWGKVLNQATEVFNVTWFCFQWADWTSSCAVQV